MMKSLLFLILLFMSSSAIGQEAREAEVQKAVDTFFESFHQRDTVRLRAMLAPDVTLHSIGADREGNPVMRAEPMDTFLASIARIPDTVQILEKLLDYQVRVDGNMAHAWTPYAFYLDGAFHHCGVNSFQLYHDGEAWRILHIADTRRVEGCEP